MPRISWKALGCTGLLLLLLVPYGYLDHFLGGPVSTWWYRRPFDPQVWQEERRSMFTRSDMVEDLLASGRLDGRTRAEVHRLLGPTGDTDTTRTWDQYPAGSERAFWLPGDVELRVFYDSTGRVERAGRIIHPW